MMPGLHHVGYWVGDLDSALTRWGQHLGVGPFQVIEHVPFEEFVLTDGGQRYGDVVFDHSAALAAWSRCATACPFRQVRWLINIPASWRDAAAGERRRRC